MSNYITVPFFSNILWIVGLGLLAQKNANMTFGWFIAVPGLLASIVGNMHLVVIYKKDILKEYYPFWFTTSSIFCLFSMVSLMLYSLSLDACLMLNDTNIVPSMLNYMKFEGIIPRSAELPIIGTNTLICKSIYICIAGSCTSMLGWMMTAAALSKQTFCTFFVKKNT